MLTYFHAFCNQYPPRVLSGGYPPRRAWSQRRRRSLAWCGMCARSVLLWRMYAQPLLRNLTHRLPRGLYRLFLVTTLTTGIPLVCPLPSAVVDLLGRRGSLTPHTRLRKLAVALLASPSTCTTTEDVSTHAPWNRSSQSRVPDADRMTMPCHNPISRACLPQRLGWLGAPNRFAGFVQEHKGGSIW